MSRGLTTVQYNIIALLTTPKRLFLVNFAIMIRLLNYKKKNINYKKNT